VICVSVIGSLTPFRHFEAEGLRQLSQCRADLHKQPIGNGAEKRGAVGQRPDIGARPAKTVELARHNPASLPVKAKVTLYICRHFNRLRQSIWWAVRHRCDENAQCISSLDAGQHHHDRPVFQAFFLPGRRFARPEIGVGQDITRRRDWPAVARLPSIVRPVPR